MTSQPSPDAINWACIGYRHDFGLLSEDDAQPIRTDGLLWLEAWQSAYSPAAGGPDGLGDGWTEPNAHIVDAACLQFDPGFRTRRFHDASATRRDGLSWLQAWRKALEGEVQPSAPNDHPQRPVIREPDEPLIRPGGPWPELIVVRDQNARRFVERQIVNRPHIHCVAVTQGISAFLGRTWARVTVSPDVDLNADFHGEGPLRALLLRRTQTWGDAATVVQLP